MTGPIKLAKSVGGPTFRLATSARSCSLNPPFHTDDATYRRDNAEHFWPWYSNAPRTVCVTALRISAEEWIRWKFFPPVSPTMRG